MTNVCRRRSLSQVRWAPFTLCAPLFREELDESVDISRTLWQLDGFQERAVGTEHRLRLIPEAEWCFTVGDIGSVLLMPYGDQPGKACEIWPMKVAGFECDIATLCVVEEVSPDAVPEVLSTAAS